MMKDDEWRGHMKEGVSLCVSVGSDILELGGLLLLTYLFIWTFWLHKLHISSLAGNRIVLCDNDVDSPDIPNLYIFILL